MKHEFDIPKESKKLSEKGDDWYTLGQETAGHENRNSQILRQSGIVVIFCDPRFCVCTHFRMNYKT